MCLHTELLNLKIGFDYSAEWLRKNRKMKCCDRCCEGGVTAFAHKGRPLIFLLLLLVMIFIAVCIRIRKIPQTCPLKSLILGEVVEWRTAACILSEIDCFKWKKKSLEIVFKWKMYALANIPSAWCPSKKEDYSCLLWHFIKNCVLIQVTWAILQNLFFCFPLHLSKV